VAVEVETKSPIREVIDGDRSWWIEQTDVLAGLASLPDNSVHMVVTSPPYWGLRAYGTNAQVWGGLTDPVCRTEGHEWGALSVSDVRIRNGEPGGLHDGRNTNGLSQTTKIRASQGAFCQRCGAWRGELGSEPTIALYVEHITTIFREIRRVLRPDGCAWLNIGDSYASGTNEGRVPSLNTDVGGWQKGGSMGDRRQHDPALKAKDLCLIPERLAIALQDDGWWIRSRIAWCKTSAMPGSQQDRPTSAWEHVWLLSKSARYYFDMDAVRTPVKEAWQVQTPSGWMTGEGAHDGVPGGRYEKRYTDEIRTTGAAFRDVWFCEPEAPESMAWVLGPDPLREDHYAAFPRELVKRCVLAGSSEHGVCPTCGAPWRRVRKPTEEYEAVLAEGRGEADWYPRYDTIEARENGNKHGKPNGGLTAEYQTTGWEQTCRCPAHEPVAAVILDPFMGSGTTALVSVGLGRRAVGFELSPKYVKMARRRVGNAVDWDAPLRVKDATDLGPMFELAP
jgi:DNA modification methylase